MEVTFQSKFDIGDKVTVKRGSDIWKGIVTSVNYDYSRCTWVYSVHLHTCRYDYGIIDNIVESTMEEE